MRGGATHVFKGEIDLEASRMSVETITLGCRLNFAESEMTQGARRRRHDHRQQLRGDRRGGAPDPPGDPPRPPRPARCAHRRHRLRGPARARRASAPCPRSTRSCSRISTCVPPVAAGFSPTRAQLRRRPDRLRPSLHLLHHLAGARAEPLAAVRGDPRRGRARTRRRRGGDRPHRRRHHQL